VSRPALLSEAFRDIPAARQKRNCQIVGCANVVGGAADLPGVLDTLFARTRQDSGSQEFSPVVDAPMAN